MNKIEIEKKRRKLCKEFHKDARSAVIGYVKEMYPKTWFLRLLFSFAWVFNDWVCYFKYTPYWYEEDHWFFKKWDIQRGYWHSEYLGFLKKDPSIKFEFYAWLCFRSGF